MVQINYAGFDGSTVFLNMLYIRVLSMVKVHVYDSNKDADQRNPDHGLAIMAKCVKKDIAKDV